MVSEIFLASLVPKLLLLAGTDRLDKTPTIGQMQGKFQMVVVRNTGHAIQIPELAFHHNQRSSIEVMKDSNIKCSDLQNTAMRIYYSRKDIHETTIQTSKLDI
ncbi:protein phosphatase methylesterase-1 [Salvia divinorum]|uniref:Protein phosphatase methylesterase-1 n=1 Tax=Salvia divinorum TaxID=28513 RepID=A0ABD1FT63_SALDI